MSDEAKTQQQKDAAYIDLVWATVEEYAGQYGYTDVTRYLTPYELTKFVQAALREIDRLREIAIIAALAAPAGDGADGDGERGSVQS